MPRDVAASRPLESATGQDAPAEPVRRDVRAASPSPRAGRRRGTGLAWSERFGLPVLGLAMVVGFSVALPDTFASAANWRAIATSSSVLAVAAMALMMPLIAGRFDISVGSNVGATSIACAAVMSKTELPLVAAVLVAVVIGLAVGLVNGLLVAYVGVNSIIATLGISIVLDGLVQAYTAGTPISSHLSRRLTDLSTNVWFGVPALFVLMLLVAVAFGAFLNRTRFGRYTIATGVNETAARLNGLNTRRVVLGAFVVTGGLSSLAGVGQVAAQGNGNPQVGSITFILPALAAVFLGATTWRPGTYNVPGTVLGLFFVGIAVSGLAILGVPPWVTTVFNGTAVVVAVALSAVLRRQRTGVAALGT